ncbi:transposase, partial [Pasteurellaceae bacterium 15-036681]
TVNLLLHKLKDSQIQFGCLASDKWGCFRALFKGYIHLIGRKYTIGIEGNNCRLRHRIRRVFRKSCNFSKLLDYHFKVFSLVFSYLNIE